MQGQHQFVLHVHDNQSKTIDPDRIWSHQWWKNNYSVDPDCEKGNFVLTYGPF